MDNFKVLKSLCAYEENINDSPKSKPVIQKQMSKMELANFNNIILTNEKYKSKMNRSSLVSRYETFSNNSELNDFIEKDMLNLRKKYQWSKLPKSFQKTMCEDFINNDTSIDDQQRSSSLDNIQCVIPHVVYDKANGTIKSINYQALYETT